MKDEEIEAHLKRLRERKVQLTEMLALEGEIANLEMRILSVRASASRVCHILSELVCEYYGLSLETLMGKTRRPVIVVPRWTLFYLLLRVGNLGSSEVGRIFRFDHATVLHGEKAILREAETNGKVRHDLDELLKMAQEEINKLRIDHGQVLIRSDAEEAPGVKAAALASPAANGQAQGKAVKGRAISC